MREENPSSNEMAFAGKKVILGIRIWKKCLDRAGEFWIKNLSNGLITKPMKSHGKS
jgi:hypothetical protein